MRIIRVSQANAVEEYRSRTCPDVTLTVGEIQRNRVGEYMVMAINPGTGMMEVEYISGDSSGQTKMLDMEGQCKVIRNMRAEFNRENRLRPVFRGGASEVFSIGVLAANAFIHIQTPESERSTVEKRYERMAGEQLDGNPSYEVVPDEGNKWHYQLRVSIGSRVPQGVIDGMSFGEGVEVRPKRAGGHEINNSNFVWNLIAIGFKAGRNHDIAKIRDSVCKKDSDRESFDDGLAAASSERVASLRLSTYSTRMSKKA